MCAFSWPCTSPKLIWLIYFTFSFLIFNFPSVFTLILYLSEVNEQRWIRFTAQSKDYLILDAFNSKLSFSRGMILNNPLYSRSPITLASGSMMAMIPFSDGFPILSDTLPWALVRISRLSMSPLHSRIIALYRWVMMNRRSFLSVWGGQKKKIRRSVISDFTNNIIHSLMWSCPIGQG